MSEVSTLHKKLLEPWSSITISKIISSSLLLDDIRISFNNFEKKAQMRILLALLDIDPKKRNELIVPIRKLLEIANKSEDDWVIITAGIVNNHLFGKSNNDIDNNTLTKISEIADVAIQRIKESTKLSTSQSFYFQPYEYRYLSSELTNGVTNQKSENLNFVHTGHKPDFILREKQIFEKKSSGDVPKQKTNLGARITTNNNISSSISNIQKKPSLSMSSNNASLNKSTFNKSKMISMESMKAINPNPTKKRPSTSSVSSLEKKAKVEE